MGDPTPKDAKYTKVPTAEMSRLFALKNVEVEFVNPVDSEVGQKDPDGPLGNPAPNCMLVHKTLTSRWVYIFQSLGDKITWFAEHWLDKDGLLHPVDMKAARDKERNKRPDPSKADDGHGGQMTLPHTVNGKRAYYAFFVIGTRLPLESIHKLATPENFKKLFSGLGIDLKKDESYKLFDPREDKHLKPPPGTEQPYILVFDALRYGMSANRALQKLRDREVAWLVPAKNLPAAQRERTEARQKKKLIASTVKALLDGDPNDRLSIKKKLKVDDLNNWLSDYDSKTMSKKANCNALVGHVQEFLMERFHMQFTVEANMLLEKVDPDGGDPDLAQFMQDYADTIDRFIETDQGLKYLTKVVDDKSHFIHNYVMNTSNAPRLYFAAFRRMPRAFMWIFKEVFIPYRAKYGTSFRATMVDPLYGTIIAREFSVDLESFRWTNKTGHVVTVTRDANIRVIYNDTFTRPTPGARSGADPLGDTVHDPHAVTVPGNQPAGPTVTRDGGLSDAPRVNREVNMTLYEVGPVTVTTTHTPTNWSKYFTDKDIANIQNAAKEFTQVLTVLNMGLAMFDLGDKGVNTWSILNAAASLGNTVVALEAMTLLAEATLRRIAFVTAIFDTVNSVHNALHAYDKGDKVAALGFSITALGSLVAVAGLGMTLFVTGAATSWTGIGAVIAIIGALVVLFGGSNDSEIQLFAKHCIWGVSYGEDGGDDKWQEGRFENWHESKSGGLDHQIKAMMNILQGFSIEGRAWTVRISLGIHNPKSKLQVKLEADYADEHHEREVVIAQEPKNKTGTKTRIVDPKDADRNDTGGVSASYGGDYFDITWYFGSNKYGVRQDEPQLESNREMDISVRLDLNGDGKTMIPPSGKWVKYHTVALAWRKPARSLDNL